MSYEAYVKHINSIIEEDLKEVEEKINSLYQEDSENSDEK